MCWARVHSSLSLKGSVSNASGVGGGVLGTERVGHATAVRRAYVTVRNVGLAWAGGDGVWADGGVVKGGFL